MHTAITVIDPSGLQQAVKQAAREAGIPKRVIPQTLRHFFAPHLLQAGYDICTVVGTHNRGQFVKGGRMQKYARCFVRAILEHP